MRCKWSDGLCMILVKLLELVGNHIYLQYANCFLSDNQVVMYCCTRYTVLGLHFGIYTTGGDMGEGKGRIVIYQWHF